MDDDSRMFFEECCNLSVVVGDCIMVGSHIKVVYWIHIYVLHLQQCPYNGHVVGRSSNVERRPLIIIPIIDIATFLD